MRELFYSTLEYLLFMYGLDGITIIAALPLILECIYTYIDRSVALKVLELKDRHDSNANLIFR